MPDRGDANLFEILVGQVTQNIEINIILGKALSVLPETKLFEPVRNLLHRRSSTDLTLSILDRHVVRVYQISPGSSTLGPRRRAPYRTTPCSGIMHARSSWFGIGALNSLPMSAFGGGLNRSLQHRL